MAILDSLRDHYAQVRQWIEDEVNFFRLHLVYFTFVPLIAAGIFYGANGEFHIPFIDALFLCYSALTVTGLSTVNLSTLTVFQQAILFVLMIGGDVTIVAWVMVLVRLRYFRAHIIETHRKKTIFQSFRDRVGVIVSGVGKSTPARHPEDGTEKHETYGSHGIQASDGIGAALAAGGATGLGLGIALGAGDDQMEKAHAAQLESAWNDSHSIRIEVNSPRSTARASPSEDFMTHVGTEEHERGIVADVHSFTSSPRSGAIPLQSPISPPVQRMHFAAGVQDVPSGNMRRRPGVPVPRRRTIIVPPKMEYAPNGQLVLGQREKDQGLGGFPGPFILGRRLARRYFPTLYRKLSTLVHVEPRPARKGKLKWLSEGLSDLVIGRNSEFNTDELSDEQLEELGGIERTCRYRALRMLNWIVISYFIGTQLVSFTLFAPWLSTTHAYDDVFNSQFRLVNKSWYVRMLTHVVGSYTGGGMSLVDAGMVPFQKAYLMIFGMMFAILAGNHGLVSVQVHGSIIWICTKVVKDGGTNDQVLHFLLDHPRRCFLYLFPSHVTWFLVVVLILLTAIEWAAFIVLNIGLDVTSSLSAGVRALAGLFQSFAIRASGFAIVSLASTAPSFQFLCVIMMYIAIYPVALSIRSTNVYEEKSLGVFEPPEVDEDEEPNLDEKQPRRERIGKYFGWHLRRQLAFDIWWLVSGIFLICIIERTKIMDDVNAPWFNVFRIVFELVSAFGGIGLTLGIPTENFSFCGAFGPLSKLVVIIIMVRGRHRGLPVAIDRAILLPEELVPANHAASSQAVANSATPLPLDQVGERETGAKT
ncbi:TrkH-domain-containing protein [Dichomitus squalens]|uniref:TrkH-domain-containing protein n=1 Tax=Dichomitus squalens TaxID=114155 RepID=A0A4Q9PWD6_9APHY|nr:TrkH-domain-containing protein [Dichomitus squalens]